MASTALLRRLPSPALVSRSAHLFHPLRAMRVHAARGPQLNVQASASREEASSAVKGLALVALLSFPALPALAGVELPELDPGTAKLAIQVLSPLFAGFNLAFIVRIVMSWYPQIPVGKFPFSIAYAPTEPVLGPTRRLIPPVGGVDVAPVIWVALLSLVNEVLLGQQGLLVLLSQQQP